MKHFHNRYYDIENRQFVSVYDELPLWSAPFGLALLEKIRFRKSINILDIGCGTGFPLLEIAQRSDRSCRIFGVDPWLSALLRIQEKLDLLQLSSVETIHAYAEELPFDDAFFGLIVSNNGINNVENPEKVLSECFRVCSNRAQFVMTANLPDTMREFYEIYYDILKERNRQDELSRLDNHIHSRRKTVAEMTQMLVNAGFTIQSVDESSFSMRFANGTTLFNHFFIKLAFIDSWKAIPGEKDNEEVLFLLEKRLNQLAEETGEVSLRIPFVCIDCSKSC